MRNLKKIDSKAKDLKGQKSFPPKKKRSSIKNSL